MKEGLKGRILRKLRSIPQVGYLPQSQPPRPLRELPLNLAQEDGDPLPDPNRRHHPPPLCKNPPPAEFMRDPEEDGDGDDISSDGSCGGKENVTPTPSSSTSSAAGDVTAPPSPTPKGKFWEKPIILPDNPRPSGQYRRPDFNSCSLFDPDLLAAFEQAVMEHTRAYMELCRHAHSTAPNDDEEEEEQPQREKEVEEQHLHRGKEEEEEEEEPPYKVPRRRESSSSCSSSEDGFEEEEEEGVDAVRRRSSRRRRRGLEVEEWRCPAGGGGAVVLYTTSLRGIRKTFEDCSRVRFLLCGLRVAFFERDVSMHLAYRHELWRILGGRPIPPRLFIRGTYVGGAHRVLSLHEQGRLLPLLRGLPSDLSGGAPCRCCGGARFLPCPDCSGGRKVFQRGEAVRCPRCNENGLVVCHLCCPPTEEDTSSSSSSSSSSQQVSPSDLVLPA